MTDRRYDPNVTRSVQDPDVVAPQATVPRFDSRTRLLLEGPIVGTLLRLATPNVLVMFVQAAVGLIETYFVAKLGTDRSEEHTSELQSRLQLVCRLLL